MKYVKRMPQTDRELSNELLGDGWKRIKEPGSFLTALLLSTPFMIINGVICWYLFLRYHKPLTVVINDASSMAVQLNFNPIAALLLLLFLTLLHELLHAVLIPNFIKSEITCWGVELRGGFVSTTEELSKSRFIIISLAPYIILSLFLPVALQLLGLLNSLLSFAAFFNALGASIDILGLSIVALQVPTNARIISNGSETFYK